MGWTLFFMIVILKIPMIAALWLIWYAIKEPEATEEGQADEDRGPRRKLPPRPRWPRRGPVLGGGDCKPPPCPQEVTEPLERPAPAYAGRPERV
jgi:hypothetical protein